MKKVSKLNYVFNPLTHSVPYMGRKILVEIAKEVMQIWVKHLICFKVLWYVLLAVRSFLQTRMHGIADGKVEGGLAVSLIISFSLFDISMMIILSR